MPPPEESPRCRHRFRGLLLKLGVFLLLGVVVNVAVAWGCAIGLNSTVGKSSVLNRALASGTWWAQSSSRAGACVYVIIRDDTGATTRIGLGHAPDDLLPWFCKTAFESRVETKEASHEYRTIDTRGWPFTCMWSERLQWLSTPGSVNVEAVMGGIPYVTPVRKRGIIHYREDARTIPLRIIWPGFAINTIFYAAMLWLLWIAPGRIRRFIRVQRHCCPACGYQIDSAPGIGPRCSECGAALPASWSAKSP
jgi:hypothetical protein